MPEEGSHFQYWEGCEVRRCTQKSGVQDFCSL
ncbi:MAG: hypothetical protein GWO20_06260 [Candidatus Korarchaeota archaeon]|nr:hypothetical protein [Candidatus Korarchaeota archaeon]NIU83012.1 hypothetical protein [Candidatus Thorarchaeota archaeon]NIW13446.1 hypothetical protein [Candidatus Thorarchaeota archaeon]NIW51554.1 hypothetical protein [Candidatus Korarchaeota archaeon]